MPMKFLLGSFCILTIFSAQLFGNEEKLIAGSCSRKREPAPEPVVLKQECKERGPHPMRVSARYTSPRGIGYSPGYTTLEGFFSQMYNRWVPFLDLRGHAFDNGRLAANAGVGIRYLAETRVWGANAYYDYRNASHRHYNQVAAGLESLGRVWDFRLNGYLPVGKKQSPLRHARFKEFLGHTMYIRARRNSALAGANFEAGLHVDHFKSAPLYFNAGPYYLHGKGVTTWGGQLRGAVDLCDQHLRIEANVSYDHVFKWIGQGQLSVNAPFGGRAKMRNSGRPCGRETALYTRTAQRVDRNEIIPVGKTHVIREAIDPATGEPYFFVFVDNNSSSNGTYESPYPTLLLAQNNSSPKDVIYVFPGDGTSRNMDAGIILKDSQMLLGASTTHRFITTLGNVSIPPLAPIMPVLTNSLNEIITLANNNLVSGIHIEKFTPIAILGNAITNFTAMNNEFFGQGIALISGEVVNMVNVKGQINIIDNLFVLFDTFRDMHAINVRVSHSDACDIRCINNTFARQGVANAGVDIRIISFENSLVSANLENNDFIGSGYSSAIALLTRDNSILSNVIIKDSSINFFDTGILIDVANSSSIENISISNCAFNNNLNYAIHSTGTSTIGLLEINKSNFLSNKIAINLNSPIQNGFIENNIFNGSVNGSLQASTYNPSFLSILNNTFTGITGILTGAPVFPGYAAQITTTVGSTLCLDFFNNTTVPTMYLTNAPYYFNGAAGTFNITPRSTQANNIGTIQQNPPIGTCDQ